MNTLPNSEKVSLLFCIGALMAAEHEEAAGANGTPLVEATLAALATRPVAVPPPRPRPRGRAAGRIDPWVRG